MIGVRETVGEGEEGKERRRKVGRQMVREGVSGREEERRKRFRERCFLEKTTS